MGHLGNTKPTTNIVTLGHNNHGKTTLFKAISGTFGQVKAKPYQGIANASIEYQSGSRSYRQFDLPSHRDIVKLFLSKEITLDGAILVVSAADGPDIQTREHLLLAYEMNINQIVVFLSNCDQIQGESRYELIERVELEIRDSNIERIIKT